MINNILIKILKKKIKKIKLLLVPKLNYRSIIRKKSKGK